jgi:Fe2+ transport system protein FeoA
LASSRSDIENALGIDEGCEVIVVQEAEFKDLELEIETVCL